VAFVRKLTVRPVSQDFMPRRADAHEVAGLSTDEVGNGPDGGYDNWCAVAAFFDGDGCVQAGPKKDTVFVKMEFADNWRPQLQQLQAFIRSRGIPTGEIKKMMGGAYHFVVASQEGVISAARAMLATRCCFKKRKELEWALQYFDDRLTGTAFIEKLNDNVSCGNRTGKIRHVDVPFLHSEGSKQRYFRSAARRRVLTEEQKRQIVIDRGLRGMTLAGLAAKYAVSITTIARVVGNRRDRGTWRNSK
jgi:hypothetical protein